MRGRLFSNSVKENKSIIREIYKDDDMLIINELKLGKRDAFIISFDGMTDSLIADLNVIKPMKSAGIWDKDIETLCREVISVSEFELTESVMVAACKVESGDMVVFLDGECRAAVISVKGFKTRSVDEPEFEKLVRGPREGFNESLVTNTSLIRRKLQTPDLKIKIRPVSKCSGQNLAMCWLESTVDRKALSILLERLEKIDISTALDSNYIEQLINDSKYSPFKTIGSTEKPDIAAAKLLEGKIILIVDGSPMVLTIPFLFMEYFQSGNDYYINYIYGSFTRFLRIMGFIITVTVPAVYLSLISFHQEILPTSLLMSIAAAREGVPFTAFVELILMMITYEMLREAGVMMPNSIGEALSTVGGVAIGQAAVDARFISAPLVIVIALSGLTGLMVPKLKGPIILLRFAYVIFSVVLGLYGFAVGVVLTLLWITRLKTFGHDYTEHLGTLKLSDLKDTLIRAPWKLRKDRNGSLI